MAVLLPGGIGYIGSHTAVELLNRGKDVVVIDNFSNSEPATIEKIEQITGKKIKFYEGDYTNREIVEKIFEENNIEAVINFAGYKAVGESVKEPLKYYYNNITGCVILLETMKNYGVKNILLLLTI